MKSLLRFSALNEKTLSGVEGGHVPKKEDPVTTDTPHQECTVTDKTVCNWDPSSREGCYNVTVVDCGSTY